MEFDSGVDPICFFFLKPKIYWNPDEFSPIFFSFNLVVFFSSPWIQSSVGDEDIRSAKVKVMKYPTVRSQFSLFLRLNQLLHLIFHPFPALAPQYKSTVRNLFWLADAAKVTGKGVQMFSCCRLSGLATFGQSDGLLGVERKEQGKYEKTRISGPYSFIKMFVSTLCV